MYRYTGKCSASHRKGSNPRAPLLKWLNRNYILHSVGQLWPCMARCWIFILSFKTDFGQRKMASYQIQFKLFCTIKVNLYILVCLFHLCLLISALSRCKLRVKVWKHWYDGLNITEILTALLVCRCFICVWDGNCSWMFYISGSAKNYIYILVLFFSCFVWSTTPLPSCSSLHIVININHKVIIYILDIEYFIVALLN